MNPLAEIVLEPGSLSTTSGVVKLVANLVVKLVVKSSRARKPQHHLRCSKSSSKASSKASSKE